MIKKEGHQDIDDIYGNLIINFKEILHKTFIRNKHDLLLKSVTTNTSNLEKSLTLPHDLFLKLPSNLAILVESHKGIVNLPALGIVSILSLLLIKGTKESAFVNGLIVITKVAIVLMIIVLGWGYGAY